MFNLFTNKFYYHSSPYKSLRIYRRKSFLQLCNALFVNRMSNSKWIVANSMKLYKISCKLISTKATGYIIQNTFGKVFTAGQTLDDVENMSRQFRKQKIPVIIDYCGQGFVDQKCVQAELDKNCQMFRLTGLEVAKHPQQMISIKISGLVDVNLLRKLNFGVRKIHQFWRLNSHQNKLTGNFILSGLKNASISQNSVSDFLLKIFNHSGSLNEFSCDQVDFKNKVHPYYLYDHKKLHNDVIQYFCALSADQVAMSDNLVRRIDSIILPHVNSSTNMKIVIDAEQSYIQDAIFSLSQQYQMRYNRDRIFLIPTLQNYLKYSVKRIDHEIAIAQRNNLYFAMKYVRGAYLVEQRRLAQQKKYQCPIVEDFNQTTVNFIGNMRKVLVANFSKSAELVVASHNQQTVEDVKRLQNEVKPQNKKIIYAQLLGLADHLTIQLNRQGQTVYKYLPYGSTDTMVPYLIRRAQQLSQMKYPLTLQHELIIDQFQKRLFWKID